MGESIAGPSSIPLYLINGVGTIWDAQSLRAGTLPGVSQQNGFLGLPITLMQEETAFLVRQGIAHLVPVNPHPSVPSPDVVEAQLQSRIERITSLEQAAQETADRQAEAAREMFVKGGDKAKAKREERAKAKAMKGAGGETLFGAGTEGEGDTIGVALVPVNPQSENQHPEHKTTNITIAKSTSKPKTTPPPSASNSIGHFHTVPSHPPSLPFITQEPITTLPHPLFPFPTTPRHCAQLRTFTTLQSLSYRMGLGPRFGGEYLIYPGDYLRYHAHFTSQVIVGEEAIKPTEIVAWGRLGTGTKKAGLICCVEGEEGEGEVSFYSLEWANFG